MCRSEYAWCIVTGMELKECSCFHWPWTGGWVREIVGLNECYMSTRCSWLCCCQYNCVGHDSKRLPTGTCWITSWPVYLVLKYENPSCLQCSAVQIIPENWTWTRICPLVINSRLGLLILVYYIHYMWWICPFSFQMISLNLPTTSLCMYCLNLNFFGYLTLFQISVKV